MKSILKLAGEFVFIIALVVAIVVPVRTFVFQPFLVRGASMEPNYHDGDYLIVDQLSYRLSEPKRGEVIVFQYPVNPSQRFIKRVIGLPGEIVEIQDGKVIIYGGSAEEQADAMVLDEAFYLPEELETIGSLKTALKEGEYFVLGDNRPASRDSRYWGVVPEKNIIGKVLVRLLPFSAFAKTDTPDYSN